MGTRADFYVGKGMEAEWIGSVAMDGYEWGERIASGDHDEITASKTVEEYRKNVSKLSKRRDFTSIEDGWPWPWDDSCMTDRAYCFVDGKVEAFSWGCPDGEEKREEWPDMREKQNITYGERSGLLIIGLAKNISGE